MSNSNFLEFQTSQCQGTVPGVWKLAPGRALSLQPHQTGFLRVAQGRVWVTADTQHQGAGNELGDYFLHAGEQMAVSTGQHLVLESVGPTGQQAAYFEWAPAREAIASGAAGRASAVTRPLRDLGLALGLVGAALAHLCTGLRVMGRQLVWGRPAPLECATRCS